jgi:hypothetical protein
MESEGLLSRRIISHVSELLARDESWSSLPLLLSRYEGLGEIWEEVSGSSKRQKLFNTLMNAAERSVAEKAAVRQMMSDKVPSLLRRLKSAGDIAGITHDGFRRALNLEGYDVVSGDLVGYPSASMDLSRQRGKLEALLERKGLETASGHWDQVTDNVARGNWASANSQMRSFLESVFDYVAAATWRGEGPAPARGEARKFLQQQGCMSEEHGELVKALFKLLHTQGSHPGLSEEVDCQARVLMTMGVALYWLQVQ